MVRVRLLSQDVNPTNGWGTMTYELCREFLRRGDVDFELHLPRNARLDEHLPFAERVHRTLPPWQGSFRTSPHHMLPYLFPSRAAGSFDVVHTLIEFPYAILARGLARKAGVPFLVTTHGTFGVAPLGRWPDRWPYRVALRKAAIVTAPSLFTVEAMQEVGGFRRDVCLLHNPVNYPRFQEPRDPREVRARYGLPENARVVLGVGALKRRKGFDLLVRAFARVVAQEPLAHLVIVGDGSHKAALQGLAAALGLADRVHLLGPVPGDDLVGLYQLCEVYTHLPRNTQWNFEGFGIVYLEAGACGKPVVATRSGGVQDAVLDGETGLLVDEEDEEGAAAALLRLLRDPVLARSLGEAGRRYAAQHTWSWYAEQVVGLYQRALDSFPTSPRDGGEARAVAHRL